MSLQGIFLTVSGKNHNRLLVSVYLFVHGLFLDLFVDCLHLLGWILKWVFVFVQNPEYFNAYKNLGTFLNKD
jgi:hypothetical protein